MTSSSFNNQQTDVEMQCEDQKYQKTSAYAPPTSEASSQAKEVKKLVVPKVSCVGEFHPNQRDSRQV